MMTISRNLRKRLRRYALLCLMAATTAGFAETTTPSRAGDTHDSTDLCDPELCGWIEELSQTTFGPEAIAEKRRSTEILAPQFLTVKFDDELTIDTCNYGDWLAGTIGEQLSDNNPANKSVAQTDAAEQTGESTTKEDVRIAANSTSRTASGFNATLATIAAAATAGNPIPFIQWTEPFAMIGPDGSHSPEQIENFQGWFDKSKDFVNQFRLDHPGDFVPLVDFDGEIKGPARVPGQIAGGNLEQSESPDDAILIVETTPTATDAEVESVEAADEPVVTEDPLVGSSPFIATIEEAYASYDLAERDATPVPLEVSGDSTEPELVWTDGLFSPSQQPFCIHSLAIMRRPGWSPLAASTSALPPTNETATDLAEPSEAATATVSAPSLVGSADCLLDELVWHVSVALEHESVTDEWLHPDRIGQEVASLVVSGDRLATRIATELASAWPAKAGPAKPIPGSGAKLLARAKVAEQPRAEGSTEPVTPQQLAQAGAIVMQWVDVARSVIDDFSDRLNDVTEVARNRGTQDETIRR